ncbi:MAG: hypothetical protein AABX77_01640, partial [Nanoarchaeota archaeon]
AWGSSDVKRDKNRYEFYVLENGVLINAFRTDVEDFVELIRSEAERYIGHMKGKFPEKSYQLENNLRKD